MTQARRRGSPGILVLLLVVWGTGCSDRQSTPVAARLPAHHGPAWPASLAIPVPDESAYTRVVLVTIDTLRADHLGSYGYLRDVTPFLDELASRGVRFAQALSTVAHTAPSHASMFTGLSPKRHGLRRNGEALTDALRR